MYILTQKSNRFETFKKFKSRMANACVLIIGDEYYIREFDEFYNEHGIKQYLALPGTLQQNGIVEMLNRTLTKKA